MENQCHRAIELATRNYNEILVEFNYQKAKFVLSNFYVSG